MAYVVSHLAGAACIVGLLFLTGLYANIDWKISYPPYLFDFLNRNTQVVARTADRLLTLHEIRR